MRHPLLQSESCIVLANSYRHNQFLVLTCWYILQSESSDVLSVMTDQCSPYYGQEKHQSSPYYLSPFDHFWIISREYTTIPQIYSLFLLDNHWALLSLLLWQLMVVTSKSMDTQLRQKHLAPPWAIHTLIFLWVQLWIQTYKIFQTAHQKCLKLSGLVCFCHPHHW